MLGLALVAAATAAYWNSFQGVFVLDDASGIADNPSIRELWPLTQPLSPPPQTTVKGRPVVNLTLAINHAFHGTDPWGYHGLNLAIHASCGLLLFGLVRRTLLLPAFAARWGDSTQWIAFFSAALWLLHPLQTESVTYVIQRVESLTALFYLLTLYCFMRSLTSSRPGRLQVCAVAACLLGMGSKEVMVSAPLVVLLYDWLFSGLAFAEIWRKRRPFYVGLAATWGLLTVLVLNNFSRGGTVGFGTPVTPWTYLLTQCWAIPHYLRLVFWPEGLVFDYGSLLVVSPIKALPGALLLLGLAAATVYGVWKKKSLSIAGVLFFAVLAPSSSIVPVASQTVAEHRMYLPLAGVVVPVVLGAFGLLSSRAWMPLTAAAVALGVATVERNRIYHNPMVLWSQTVERQPANGRAHSQLGYALVEAQDFDKASYHLSEAIRFDPGDGGAHANLAVCFTAKGKLEDAARHFEIAVQLDPSSATARYNLGATYLRLNRPSQALSAFREAVRLEPGYALAYQDLGVALSQTGDSEGALKALQQAAQLNPHDARTRSNLGNALGAVHRLEEACAEFHAALRIAPNDTSVRLSLAWALLGLGKAKESVVEYRLLLAADPSNAVAHRQLGMALAELGQTQEALSHLREAIRLAPSDAQAHCLVGAVLFQVGKTAESVGAFENAVRIDPQFAEAFNQLALAQERLGQTEKAIESYRRALQVDAGNQNAKEALKRLQR